ncbi:O-acyltransferase like protein-like isoform X2 [Venturia canescens]|uniref:O-acyltransferase like protein-like isoform X2 n=1 Tax=Venturia canescens TaxID=32260 RepID=UPI001C9CDD5D|nr:O-acyltransferase like protein-like isoform X2 [Venturia canescens]
MSGLKRCLIVVAYLGVTVLGDDAIGRASDTDLFDASVHRTRSLPQQDELDDENFERNWTTIAEVLDIYSSKNLVLNWRKNEFPIGNECERDITEYVRALKNHEMWALKADDSSGRYTNGFYWGNSFFTGSATECSYIGHDFQKKKTKYPTKPSVVGSSTIHGATELNGQPKNASRLEEPSIMPNVLDQPPYDLGFFMMKILINDTFTPTTRLIHLGVCLPFSCTASDVAIIAKLSASERAAKNSIIQKVRDQRNYYDIYADPIFWILIGSSLSAVFFMIIGTSYDFYLSMRLAKKRSMTYDLEKHAKLEQTVKGHHKLPNVAENSITVTPIVNNNNDHENSPSRSPPTPDLQPDLNVFEELLLSFSVRINMGVICDPAVGRDTISTIHGLRAISMAWVILGHTCIVLFNYSDNPEYRKVVEKKFLFQTVTNGAFSVDTFFFMGGLLVSFLYFRTNAMGDLNKLTQGTRGFVAGCLKFIGFLVYRFCRLTTPYLFVLGVVQVSMKWFHANSVFEPPTADHENCPNYWWRNVLYINTLFPVDQMCMLWSWYVADDTQFYVIGAVILIVATNHLKFAAFSVVTLLISSWLTTGYIALINNHMPSSDDPLALFDKIYDKPWTRLGPYLIGMSVGYYLFKTDCKVKMSKTTVVIGWLLSSACLLSLLYGLYEAELSPVTAAAYSSLSHSAWALGLAWIVIACSTGYGGWVNDILSAPILYPFSRVTYCAYLVHPMVIRLTAMNLDSPFHLGKDTVVIAFFGQVILSYILSFIVSVSFEAPFVSMLKILSPKKRKRIQ